MRCSSRYRPASTAQWSVRCAAYIAGTFAALPRDAASVCRIMVTFGCPELAATLRIKGTGRTEEERVADGLRQCVVALDAEASVTSNSAIVADAGDSIPQ